MYSRITKLWEENPGRVAGLIYLSMTIFVFVGASRFLVEPEAILTPTIILIARIGFVFNVFHLLLFLILGCAFYLIFSPVNKPLALVVLIAITTCVAIESINALNYMAALSLLTDTGSMSGFTTEQLQFLAALYLQTHMDATHINEFFWFLWLFAAGNIVYKSEIIPKYLGILMMVGGIGYLLVIAVFFLIPSLELIGTIGAVFAGLAELSFMAWLLVKGVKTIE